MGFWVVLQLHVLTYLITQPIIGIGHRQAPLVVRATTQQFTFASMVGYFTSASVRWLCERRFTVHGLPFPWRSPTEILTAIDVAQQQ